MKFARLVSVTVCTFGTSVFFPAFATTKKSPNAAPTKISGTVVAMSGSGSLSSFSEASKAYVGMQFLPYTTTSATRKVGNQSVDTPSSSIRTLSKQFDFYGRFGSWVVRPVFDFDLNIAGQQVTENVSYVGLGYHLSPNLELGGALSFDRRTAEDANKNKLTSSDVLMGPYGVYFSELGGFPVELGAMLFLVMGSAETTTNNITQATVDSSGFGFEASGSLVKELSKSLEYMGGLKMKYSKVTNKADKNNEIVDTEFAFTVVPAGLRFKF